MNDAFTWEKKYPEKVDWHAEIGSQPVTRLLENAVNRYGRRPAIDFLGKEYNYEQLGRLVTRAAKGLQKIGIGKGKKVGLFLPNSPYSVIFYFAILKAGGTVVNYNPLYAERELKHQIEDSETDILVTMDLKLLYDKASMMLSETRVNTLIICPMEDALPFPKNILFPLFKGKDIAKIPVDGRHISFTQIIANDGATEYVDIDPRTDVAVLQYTGGTTGVPKGAMLTHENVYANAQQTALWISPIARPGEESILAVLPFFHVFAMTAVMNLAIWYGFKMILLPKFDLLETLKTIHRKKPQYFPAVPAIYNAINASPAAKDYDLSSIRFCFSGGAPLPVDVKHAFEKKTGCILSEGYGLTESSPVLTGNPAGGDIRAGSIGLPIPGTVIEIISRDDGQTVLPVGEKGEICARGPQVMLGYYKKPEETAKVIRNGRLHTGDVGYMDPDGYIYIVDRIKDLILVRGYNVYPRNVEEAIYLHPGVEECIVAGVPDAERGETVWAWVKPVAGKQLEEADLHKFLENKLSPIEIPRRFIIRDKALPKTAVGKLSRKDLLEQEGIRRN